MNVQDRSSESAVAFEAIVTHIMDSDRKVGAKKAQVLGIPNKRQEPCALSNHLEQAHDL
jgi:hypothetical protein